jgi:hypothetical protein
MSTKPILNGTFDEASHTYRDTEGKEIISVTQVLVWNRCIDLDAVPGDTLERKRQLGDFVHRATHYLDQDDLDYSTLAQMPEAAPYINAYLNFREQTEFRPDPDWIEKSGVYQVNGMKVGYTIDRLGWLGSLPYKVVLEIKCAYRPEPSWKLQTAAYEMVIPRKSGEIIGRVAVQLKPDETFKLHPYENPRDKDAWLWNLASATWKLNEGLKFKKE